MIPLQLTLKNFMCYRGNAPVLDLEPLHVACLSGQNGHGKTALLDAITWALWGHARARTQEELVHQGERDMSVDLEFMARDQRHRVTRRHSRSLRNGQGSTILELQVTSGNGFRPISGNTLRETEARIEDLLHMDYDTFINTAYLRQGDADAFTAARPAERKRTLAEVLDLSYYDRLEGMARERSRSTQGDLRTVAASIELQTREMESRPLHQEALDAAAADLARWEPEAARGRTQVEDLRLAVEALARRRGDLSGMERQIAEGRREIDRLRGQVATHAKLVEQYEKTIARADEIRTQAARLKEARSDLARMDAALARRMARDTETARLEGEINAHRARLTAEAQALRSRLEGELRPRAERLSQVEQALAGMGERREALALLDAELAEARSRADEAASEIRDLRADNERLREQMEETRRKFDLLDHGEKICPVCRQSLGAGGQAHLRAEYETTGRRSRELYDANERRRAQLELTLHDLRAEVSRRDAERSSVSRKLERDRAGLERDLADSRQAAEQVAALTPELLSITARIEKKDFAHEQRRRLEEIADETSRLRYDERLHREVRERAGALEPYDRLEHSLAEAEERLPGERAGLETVKDILSSRRAEAANTETQLEELKEDLEKLPALEEKLEETRRSWEAAERERTDALVRRGRAEEALARLEQIAAELREQEARRDELTARAGAYDDLTAAFGKNGIQALIIEDAIPQLEADANELLSRLTESRLTLRLQLQEGRRDRRTGLPSEELDIKIGDEIGTRAYETFSGGEAFRVNFALRIALSKLLARRSGAPLPILFIDEGFGSLDASGQERLTQAIQSIQDDFKKIIVITHIDQIKEAFPSRIEVTKTPTGSTFKVV